MKAMIRRGLVFATPLIVLSLVAGGYLLLRPERPALAAGQTFNRARAERELGFTPIRQTTLDGNLYRARIPGGWLVVIEPTQGQKSTAMVYVPDPNHTWDGSNAPS